MQRFHMQLNQVHVYSYTATAPRNWKRMKDVGHKPSSSKLHRFQCWMENTWYGGSLTKSVFFTWKIQTWGKLQNCINQILKLTVAQKLTWICKNQVHLRICKRTDNWKRMNNVGHKPSSSKLHQFQCWKENSWYGDSHTKSIFFTCRMMTWKDQAPELHSSHVRFGK